MDPIYINIGDCVIQADPVLSVEGDTLYVAHDHIAGGAQLTSVFLDDPVEGGMVI